MKKSMMLFFGQEF